MKNPVTISTIANVGFVPEESGVSKKVTSFFRFQLPVLTAVALMAACGAETHEEDREPAAKPTPTKGTGDQLPEPAPSAAPTPTAPVPPPPPPAGDGGTVSTVCTTVLQVAQVVTASSTKLYLTGRIAPTCSQEKSAIAMLYLNIRGDTNGFQVFSSDTCGRGGADFAIVCNFTPANIIDKEGRVKIEIQPEYSNFDKNAVTAKIDVKKP